MKIHTRYTRTCNQYMKTLPRKAFQNTQKDKNATYLYCVLVNRDATFNLLFTILIESLLLRDNTDYDILFLNCFAMCIYSIRESTHFFL